MSSVAVANEAPSAGESRTGSIPIEDPDIDDPSGTPVVLDDVVITSTKRPQFQRTVLEDVTAVPGASLESKRAETLKDYLKLVPGVSYNDQGTEASVPIIRGVATEIGFGTAAQTIGIYLDEMPFADLLLPLSLPDLYPFDLARVEVLKGPQGTLFGAGALAGAVRYVTNKPDPARWEAGATRTISQTSLSGNLSDTWSGMLNAPLGDSLAVRVVGTQRHTPGLYDMNASDPSGAPLRAAPDADAVDQHSWRALLAAQPTDRLNLSGMYFYQDTALADLSSADQGQRAESDIAPFASPRSYSFSGANASAVYDFDEMQLTASSSRLVKRNRLLTHLEWFFALQNQNELQWYDLTQNQVDGWTHEVRLASTDIGGSSDVRWLIGGAYLRYSSDYLQYEPEPGPVAAAPRGKEDLSAAERASSFLFASIHSVGIERALFGELTSLVGERWELTGGVRAYKTSLEADTALSGAQTVVLTQQLEKRDHFLPMSSGVNPKVGVRFNLSDDISLHALASRGFQFGGVQVNPSTPVLEQSAAQAGFNFGPYKSSHLWDYEGGIRTRWLNDSLQFDLTAFWIDWRDLQLTVRVPILGTTATYGMVANVGRAHSAGVETRATAIPFPGAALTTSATIVKAITDTAFDFDNPAGPIPAGTRLPGTPTLQYSTDLSYEWSPTWLGAWSLSPSLTHLYVGPSSDALRETGRIGGYNIVDAGLSLGNRHLPYRPELLIAMKNMADERAVTFHNRLASLATGEAFDFYHFVQPRTLLASVSLRY